MSRINNKLILIGILVVFAGTLFFNHQLNQQSPEMEAIAMPILPSPTPISQESTLIHPASDGSKELILKSKKVDTNQTRYTITTKVLEGSDEDKETPIIEFLLDNDTRLEIPFNAWSTDNQYFFIEQISGSNKKYLLFKADGQALSEQGFVDINEAFKQRDPGYTLDKVTGWGNLNLLIITTRQDDQTPGPRYWFVGATQRFLN